MPDPGVGASVIHPDEGKPAVEETVRDDDPEAPEKVVCAKLPVEDTVPPAMGVPVPVAVNVPVLELCPVTVQASRPLPVATRMLGLPPASKTMSLTTLMSLRVRVPPT